MDLFQTLSWSDPVQELRRFQQDLDRVFGAWSDRRVREFPLVNLWAGEDGIVVSAELPGVDPDTVEITVHKNTLTVSGKRPDGKPAGDAAALRRELAAGGFSRTVTLPFLVDADKVGARSQDGVLVIHLPRPEADRPKHIRIATA